MSATSAHFHGLLLPRVARLSTTDLHKLNIPEEVRVHHINIGLNLSVDAFQKCFSVSFPFFIQSANQIQP